MKPSLLIAAILLFSQPLWAQHVTEGDIAPDFSMVTLDGERFSLSDYREKTPVYLVFWNSWCHYCMKKTSFLKETQDLFGDEVAILGINTGRDDSVEESTEFKRRFDVNYPLAFDDAQQVTDLYRVRGVPTEFIVDINGVIRHRDGVPRNIAEHLASWRRLTTDRAVAQK